MSQIRIGTSGWAYKHWKLLFYPDKLAVDEQLPFYARTFDTAEINYSFYKLPSVENYKHWRDETGEDFVFAVKASRYLTHMKKLIDPVDPWQKIKDTAGALDTKLGPILLQFPERWKKNTSRLEAFLEMTASNKIDAERFRLAFEFREGSWFCDEVYKLLTKYNAALCSADSLKFVRKDKVTADFAYYRYHGREPIYAANYTNAELRAEAKKIAKIAGSNIDVYTYFNNDGQGRAVKNAKYLKQLLDLE